MTSHLKFRIEREQCLRLLKEVTNETRTVPAPFANFGSILKGKLFYGQFFGDGSFYLEPTSYARGSMGPRLKGKMQDIDDGEYKCLIQVEGKVPKWSWGVLLLVLLIAVLVAQILFIVFTVLIGLVIILNSERQIQKGINSIIETIESASP